MSPEAVAAIEAAVALTAEAIELAIDEASDSTETAVWSTLAVLALASAAGRVDMGIWDASVGAPEV